MTTEKTAQGATKNPQFERSFADLAYAHVKDKSPKLLDFMVGFQVIDKNEDETKAAGVFGFKVGQQWFYAPVFFLNGELKGSELLYIKDQDSFVPLEENWVNYLISRKPATLGERTPYTTNQLGISAPDFRMYSDSPLRGWYKTSGYKFAAYDSDRVDEAYGYWHTGEQFDLRPALKCLSVSVNDPVFKEAAARMDLSKVVPSLGEKAIKIVVDQVRQRPEFGKALSQFYSGHELLPSEEKSAAVEIRPPSNALLAAHGMDRKLFKYYVEKLSSSAYTSPRGTDKAVIRILRHQGIKSAAHLRDVMDTITAVPEKVIEKTAADPKAKVEIISRQEAMDNPPSDLSDDERSELMDEGLLVRDSRQGVEKSKVYDIDMTQSLSNPQGAGLYDMISKDGKSYQVLVVPGPKTIGSGVASICLVMRTDGKGWDGMAEKNIIVRKDLLTEWKPFYDDLPGVDTVQTGKTYSFIVPSCDASLVVNVVEKAGDDLFVNVPYCSYHDMDKSWCDSDAVRFRPSIDHNYAAVNLIHDDDEQPGDTEKDKRRWKYAVRKVVVSEGVSKLTPVGDTLLVPADCKVMSLSTSNSGLGFVPGTSVDAQLILLKDAGLHKLKVWSDGLGYQLDSGALSRRMRHIDAMKSLISDYGVTKGAADIILKRADASGTDTFLVKYAQGYGGVGGPLTPGPTAPSVSVLDNTKTYDPTLDAQVDYPQDTFENVNLPLEAPGSYSPYQLDENTVQSAIEAGNSGQKEVFDTSVLGGLVKAMDTDPVIDKYLSDLVVGEDRIGRILFMFYWHNKKFSDRYGDDEMQELEDGLRNTFKSVGDLVLFLKKKTIEPDAALTGSDVDLSDIS